MTLKEKFIGLKPVSVILIGLFVVYVAQYTINQSVSSVIDFDGDNKGKYYSFS